MSKPLGRLVVHHGIRTSGASGGSLVKGVIKQLPAYAISVLAGAEVGEIDVNGGIATTGDGVVSLRVEGELRALRVNGGVNAAGKGADAVVVDGGTVPLTNLDVTAERGAAIRLKGAKVTAMLGVAARGAAGGVVVESDSRVTTEATTTEALASTLGNAFAVSGPEKIDLQPFGP